MSISLWLCSFLTIFGIFALIVDASECDRRPLMYIKAVVSPSLAYSPSRKFRYLENVKLTSLIAYQLIDVTNTTIPELCQTSVRDLPALETLSMNDLGMERIHPGAFQNVFNLKHLALSMNKLKRIEEGVFNGLNLRTLYLSGNKIEEIEPEAFSNMPELRVLHVDNNRIRFIESRWFFNSPSIRTVDLKFNRIVEIPKHAFENLNPDHGDMVVIKLQNNKIVNIDREAFEGVNSNWVLQLSHNGISGFFTEYLYNALKNFKEVDLRSNGIECVPDEVSSRIANTEVRLNIEDNPINCQCLKQLRRYFKRQKNVLYSSTLNCFSPYK